MPQSPLSSSYPRRNFHDAKKPRPNYEPLPEGDFLRVLKLHPGCDDDKIECSLETVALQDSKSQYEAISYVWGDPNDTVDVTCNGLRVHITISLAEALRNFRDPHSVRTLWADALCINQDDNSEKGHQVRRMGDVFANAKRVLVWLGPDSDNVAKDIFTLICETNQYFEQTFEKNNRSVYNMPKLEVPYPICVNKTRWSRVTALLRFPWFKRVWTVQEAAVNTDCRLFWGTESINVADVFEIHVWSQRNHDFRALVQVFDKLDEDIMAMYSLFNIHCHYETHGRDMWQTSRAALEWEIAYRKEKSFIGVIRSARGLQATDPRDRIYAFLGCPLAKDKNGQPMLEADYTLSIDELHLRFAHTMLQRSREGPLCLSAIEHGRRGNLVDSFYPSWVPRWHVDLGFFHLAKPAHWFRAGGSPEHFSARQARYNTLIIGGALFDKVVWKSDSIDAANFSTDSTCSDTEIFNSEEPSTDRLWNDLRNEAKRLGIRLEMSDYVHTLMSGYPAHGAPFESDSPEHLGIFKAYRQSNFSGTLNKSDTKAVKTEETLFHDFFKNHIRLIYNGRLILTGNGRLGLVSSPAVEIGDDCCIFFGAKVPFILTPVRDGHHKLIGECYIHGVMDGELVEGLDSGDVGRRQILLE